MILSTEDPLGFFWRFVIASKLILFFLYTGILRAIENLDYETQSRHNFKVVVSDNAGHNCGSDIFIELLDVNDNKPTFDQSLYVATVHENTSHAVIVTQVCFNFSFCCYYLVECLVVLCERLERGFESHLICRFSYGAAHCSEVTPVSTYNSKGKFTIIYLLAG